MIDLDAASKSSLDPALIWDRMINLDSVLGPLAEQADSWALASSTSYLETGEQHVAMALRGMARIKINR